MKGWGQSFVYCALYSPTINNVASYFWLTGLSTAEFRKGQNYTQSTKTFIEEYLHCARNE